MSVRYRFDYAIQAGSKVTTQHAASLDTSRAVDQESGDDMTEHLQHWRVDVFVNGELLVCIEHNSLSGRANMTDAEEETVRLCGENLLSFIGKRKQSPPAPDWHDRPTGPGLWVAITNRGEAETLSVRDVEHPECWRHWKRFYGPIPQDKG